MKKDPPPLSPPKVTRKLISQMSEASHIPLCMKQAYEPDYEFIPVYMEGEEPPPKRGSEAPQTPVRKTGPDRYEKMLLEDEFTLRSPSFLYKSCCDRANYHEVPALEFVQFDEFKCPCYTVPSTAKSLPYAGFCNEK
eukprot:scaffold3083_cov33-Attheya_sp.AAC.1